MPRNAATRSADTAHTRYYVKFRKDKRRVRQAPVPIIKALQFVHPIFPIPLVSPSALPSQIFRIQQLCGTSIMSESPCLPTPRDRELTSTKRYRLPGTAASLPAPTLNVSPPSPVHQSFSPPSPVDGYPATSDTHKPLVEDQSKRGMKSMFRRSGMFGSMFERQLTPYQPTMPRSNLAHFPFLPFIFLSRI